MRNGDLEIIRRQTRTVERDLTADEEDEKGDEGPQDLLLEGDPALGRGDLRQDAHHRADELEETHHLGLHARAARTGWGGG